MERKYKNNPFLEQLIKKLYVECLLPEIMSHNILDAD